MKKLIIPIVIIVAIIFLFLHHEDKASFDRANPPKEVPIEATGGASGQFARVSSNTIVVTDQLPGDKVFVNTVFNEKPGFVIIQKDSSGNPGGIVGVSKWLVVGDNSRLGILTSENLVDGLPYYATLYADDGNGFFDPKDDKPVMSSNIPITSKFMADKMAIDPQKVQVNF